MKVNERKPSKSISAETRHLVLEAAWQRMSTPGGMSVGMAEIAAAAGVSRQTLFYAFGNRPGLLVAMVRHRDEQTDHVRKLAELARGDGADAASLRAFTDTWIDYLPIVYPVAYQMETSAAVDADIAVAWNDRFFNKGLRRGFERILGRMAAASALPRGADTALLADLCLSLVVPSAWHLLVKECRWTPDRFRASRHQIMQVAIVGQKGPR
jgi:AcrR family transcriptional regulator